ncbi:hypothetical protein CB0940_11092 [Cercospora beticola]|uniref:Uncharacterized protein n=1 Tax=Cercospora beticola TaxID=122368 RepID=A0A2G5HDV4_CERBT|nr:hypothetical protein CB0940_11092 [Cercospora beticola]PIA90721.1 hypothetical protein CB0940_11092 [Cercospora beticola]
MTETALLSPTEDHHNHNTNILHKFPNPPQPQSQSVSQDPRSRSLSTTTTALPIIFSPHDLLPTPQRTFTILPSTEDIKEVHCHNSGLQPYTIKRKTQRPGRRPMITIASLPGREIVAGTKAGRRECHIFVGNPEKGATVWLPVVQNSTGIWTFNANERVLRWREKESWLNGRGGGSSGKGGDLKDFELMDAISAEPLAEYRTKLSGGAVLEIYCDMEQSLELLTMASILAILERGRTTKTEKGGKSGERKGSFLVSESSSPTSSRSASPCTVHGMGD